MKKAYTLLFLLLGLGALATFAQRNLTLEECRSLALQGNKKLASAKMKTEAAANIKEAAKTLYLPKASAVLGYEHFGREISLLNDDQKASLGSLGTNLVANAGGNIGNILTSLAQQGIISPQQAQQLGQMAAGKLPALKDGLNSVGESVRDAFRTDNRNMFAGAVMISQPIYMGGAITAANEMASITEKMTSVSREQIRQELMYSVNNAFWLTVQLSNKQKLAQEYFAVVSKLNEDVQKMIGEGVATKADGLKVAVKQNEAETTLLQVEDGLKLSKMLLCQLCGLPLDSDIELNTIDLNDFKDSKDFKDFKDPKDPKDSEALDPNDFNALNRPELRLLSHTADLSRQSTKMLQALNRPQVLLTGGYMISNPSIYNGFEKKFGGNWNIGVMARIPIWDWKSTKYKVNASKAMTHLAELELEEATELINLQVSQSRFKISEAKRHIGLAQKSIDSAKENLRCANLGFAEGVMTTTDVMEAQTAWLQAETQLIDAKIGLELAKLSYNKAIGNI